MPASVRPVRTPLRHVLACLAVAAAAAGLVAGNARGEPPAVLRARIQALGTEEHGVLLSLYGLEAELERARSQRDKVQAQLAQIRREQSAAKHRLAIARHVLAASQRRLGETLAAIYEAGDADPLAILLGATTIESLVNGLDDLDRTARAHATVASQARLARARIGALAKRLGHRAAQTRSLEAEAKATAGSLAQAQAQRSAYLSHLRFERDANESALATAEAQARASQARAQEAAAEQAAAPSTASFGAAALSAPAIPTDPVSPPAAPAPAPAPPPLPEPPPVQPALVEAPASGARTLMVTSTAYALRGSTATGIPVGWGVVSVDPGVIPLGTRMTIPGYGEGVAADTGPGVQGLAIDVWVASEAQAQAWGRKTITITLR